MDDAAHEPGTDELHRQAEFGDPFADRAAVGLGVIEGLSQGGDEGCLGFDGRRGVTTAVRTDHPTKESRTTLHSVRGDGLDAEGIQERHEVQPLGTAEGAKCRFAQVGAPETTSWRRSAETLGALEYGDPVAKIRKRGRAQTAHAAAHDPDLQGLGTRTDSAAYHVGRVVVDLASESIEPPQGRYAAADMEWMEPKPVIRVASALGGHQQCDGRRRRRPFHSMSSTGVSSGWWPLNGQFEDDGRFGVGQDEGQARALMVGMVRGAGATARYRAKSAGDKTVAGV